MRTPSWVKPAEPPSRSARKPTAVVSAPKKMARPSLATASSIAAGVVAAFVARLLVAAENQDREIDAEPNEDRAHPDRHHVELVENEEPDREGDEAAEEERKPHPEERKPAAETNKKNRADEQDRAEQGDDDIVAHAERNLRDIGRAAGDQDLERRRPPSPRLAVARNALTFFMSAWQSKALIDG